MELRYGNSDKQTTIANNVDISNYYIFTKEKLDEIGLKSHFERFVLHIDHIFVDFGSHHSFFYIYGSSDELAYFLENYAPHDESLIPTNN